MPARRHIAGHDKERARGRRASKLRARQARGKRTTAAARDRRSERTGADPLRRLGSRRPLHRLL